MLMAKLTAIFYAFFFVKKITFKMTNLYLRVYTYVHVCVYVCAFILHLLPVLQHFIVSALSAVYVRVYVLMCVSHHANSINQHIDKVQFMVNRSFFNE